MTLITLNIWKIIYVANKYLKRPALSFVPSAVVRTWERCTFTFQTNKCDVISLDEYAMLNAQGNGEIYSVYICLDIAYTIVRNKIK